MKNEQGYDTGRRKAIGGLGLGLATFAIPTGVAVYGASGGGGQP